VAAFQATRNEEPFIAFAHAHNRLTNFAVLKDWSKIDQAVPSSPTQDSALLTLYLSLGWSQANTTWEWPDSARWHSILAGSPPAHWLPRSQWHFCWWLYQPENVEYRGGFHEALEEGMSDSEHPGLAAAIRAVAVPKEA
jgi:hypothetical protein